jgi:hypothetical protein
MFARANGRKWSSTWIAIQSALTTCGANQYCGVDPGPSCRQEGSSCKKLPERCNGVRRAACVCLQCTSGRHELRLRLAESCTCDVPPPLRHENPTAGSGYPEWQQCSSRWLSPR